MMRTLSQVALLGIVLLVLSCPAALGPVTERVAAPTFTPQPGTYAAAQTIEIRCATEGAEIRYTIADGVQGTDPDSASTLCAGGIEISGYGTVKTIRAIATKGGMIDSPIAEGTYSIVGGKVAAPQLSPFPGFYTGDQAVTLSCATEGATIRYTVTEGATGILPTAASQAYDGAIPIAGNGTTRTIEAISFKEGMESSDVSSGTFSIAYPAASTPVFNHEGGSYSGDLEVTIDSSTGGATIYYTVTDGPSGRTPDSSSSSYQGPIAISGNGTIKTIVAYAAMQGMRDSAPATATFSIDYGRVSTPQISLLGGTYQGDQDCYIICSTDGATIYYSFRSDGSVPADPDPSDPASFAASGPSPLLFRVAGNGTTWSIKAVATKPGMLGSALASSKTIAIAYPTAYAPTLSKGAGTYEVQSPASITVQIWNPNSTDLGSSVSYTTDGSTPSSVNGTISTAKSTPVTISLTGTVLQAMVFGGACSDSPPASATYVLKAAAPTLSLASGAYHSDRTLTMACATAGAEIRFTTDGSDPGATSTPYAGSFAAAGPNASYRIRAIAAAPGLSPSSIASRDISVVYQYNLAASAGTGGFIHAPSGGAKLVNHGESYDLQAIPSGGYTFAGWSVSSGSGAAIADPGKASTTIALTGGDVGVTASFQQWWIRSYGSGQGSGVDQFNTPDGLALDSLGRIYIADTGNHRIVRIDDISGTGWLSLGGPTGSGVGQFSFPGSVAIGPGDKIYVGDGGNDRIVRIDNMAGDNWISYGSSGSGQDKFNGVAALAVDGGGRIYVADSHNCRVVRIDDMSGSNWTSFGSEGSAQGQFQYPYGIKLGPDGKLYVVDGWNSRIVRMDDMSGANWTAFGAYGSGDGQFDSPEDVAIAASGRIYVADGDNARVARMDGMDGSNWISWGCFGGLAGEFIGPRRIAIDPSGHILVLDSEKMRIAEILP